jgi:hypothetical protein
MPNVATTLTMQDVADLAQVSRQAVSMWRKRPRARGIYAPFPDPIEVVDGVDPLKWWLH